LSRVLDLKIRLKTEGAGMTGDDRDDEIIDWRLVQTAMRERGGVGAWEGSKPPQGARQRRPKAKLRKAKFIPFPLARRRSLVAKLAGQMAAARTGDLAELVFRGRAAKLGRAMQRSGVGQDAIVTELCALEAAVRAELWSVVVRNGGPSSGAA
jgi:Family of unknown function (DUF6074)